MLKIILADNSAAPASKALGKVQAAIAIKSKESGTVPGDGRRGKKAAAKMRHISPLAKKIKETGEKLKVMSAYETTQNSYSH